VGRFPRSGGMPRARATSSPRWSPPARRLKPNCASLASGGTAACCASRRRARERTAAEPSGSCDSSRWSRHKRAAHLRQLRRRARRGPESSAGKVVEKPGPEQRRGVPERRARRPTWAGHGVAPLRCHDPTSSQGRPFAPEDEGVARRCRRVGEGPQISHCSCRGGRGTRRGGRLPWGPRAHLRKPPRGPWTTRPSRDAYEARPGVASPTISTGASRADPLEAEGSRTRGSSGARS
jgi:hypothetical protein